MTQFHIYDLKTNFEHCPIGLDVKFPRFSWKLGSEEENCMQSAYEIKVGTKENPEQYWASGVVSSSNSIDIKYQGEALLPCTRYEWTVTVWTKNNESAKESSYFETGLLDESISAWDGAKWIGAPEKYVRSETMGVFVLESTIQLEEGSNHAGIIFGANDKRLLDSRKNQYEIAGENYIRYELDTEKIPALLKIYRVGYHPDDKKDIPFAQVPIVKFATSKEREREDFSETIIITEENRYEPHNIRIEVVGDCASTYVDGMLVDAEEVNMFGHVMIRERQLNPLAFNDTTTFPRLCEIGCYVAEGERAHFDALHVSNFREPKREIITLTADDFVEAAKEGELSKDEKGFFINGATVQMDPSCHSIPMFRREFAVLPEKEVEKARLYITARGIYDCRINGEAITETWLNPGASQFDHHLMYQTYDVTELLQTGTNGIGITLASGWWCDAQTFVLRNYNYYGDREALLAKLVITYKDGNRDVIATNETDWDYYGEGPYTYAGFFQGEHLDGRRMKEYYDFSKPGFKFSVGKPVVIEPDVIEAYSTMPPGFGREWPRIDHSKTKLVGGVNAPVYEVCRRQAVSMTNPREGLYIYDLEQEMAGVPSIRFHGEKGTKVTIRYGEMLYPNLPEYGELHGLILTENYRDAESIDQYILNGNPEGEVYCPRFTFHGYRYIEISGIDTPPALEEVESIQLSSIRKITGKLETSNPLLNRFIENVGWSQLCNFISIPTDCPQRNERMGWAGDTHVFCRTASYQSDVRLFYYRYLQALQDLQEENGQLPNIAPVGGGFGGITYESAMIYMVWELYQQYGDKEVIEEYYESMKKWTTFIRSQGMPGPAFVGPLGDWLAPEETDNNLLWNAFYGRDMELMCLMAKAIGKTEDANHFEALWKEAKQYWNETFVDKETGKTIGIDGKLNDTQCAYALPLAYHMFSEENEDVAREHLARKTEEVGYTVSTGFFGTGVLNSMLSEAGHSDMAYKLMQQTAFPSWLYPVTQGATTIWERWNSYTVENGFGGNNSMNSFNHYSLGSVLNWIYEKVLGICRDENAPGYRHFTLKPEMMELAYASGGFDTEYGRIESSWGKTEHGYHYACHIPENTSATVILKIDNGDVVEKELGSGTYHFELS